MALNRCLYLVVLAGSVVFYIASSVWFSWFLLVLLLALPFLSLLVSLPAMLSSRPEITVPMTTEQYVETLLLVHSTTPKLLPLPEQRLRLRLSSPADEKEYRYLSRLLRTEGSLVLPTEHAGVVRVTAQRFRVYDYLGLFALPRRARKLPELIVLPMPVEPVPPPDLQAFLQLRLRPKPGGGYSELHDHRPYRDGDPVRDIHWKLSLKADELIVREPMEPVKRRTVLLVDTPTSPETRDRILGQFRWLSDWMIERGYEFTVFWMDGEELRSALVQTPKDALDALILVCRAARESSPLTLSGVEAADWSYRLRAEGGGT